MKRRDFLRAAVMLSAVGSTPFSRAAAAARIETHDAVMATVARYPECLKMRDLTIAAVVEPHRGVGSEAVGHLLPNQIGYDGLDLVILERLSTDLELVPWCAWARVVSAE